MGTSTVGALLMEIVRAISSILLPRIICLGDLYMTVARFAVPGFPNCRGVIDGTHIPIRTSQYQAAQYINHKGYFSMVLQALIDHRGQFMDIFVGWSGKAHNSWIFFKTTSSTGSWRWAHSSPAGTLQLGTCRCHYALWEMQPTP